MTLPKFKLKSTIFAGAIAFASILSVQPRVDAFSLVAEIPNSVAGRSVGSILAEDGRFKSVGIASLDPSPTLSVDNAVAFSISHNKTALPISDPGVLPFFDQLNKTIGNEIQIESFTDTVFFGLLDPDQNNRYNIFLNEELVFENKQFNVGFESGIAVFKIEPGETVRVITSIPSNGYLGDDGLGAVALASSFTKPVPEPSSISGFLLVVMGTGCFLKRKVK